MVIKVGELKAAGEQFWLDIKKRYEDRLIDRYRPILKPEDIFIPVEQLLSKTKNFRQIEFKNHINALNLGSIQLPDLASNSRLAKPFAPD